ncbi:MAG TPA: SRPBCC family protein [Mycobacteriales bacterium]|nr:SRPBCC family protein [Mycobacteriales bacterium]
MVDKASASIVIGADKSAVMAVIADLEAYPEWSTAIKSVTVDELGADGRGETATFTLDAGIIKDTYTLAYDWDGDDRVDWHLVSGRALRAQEGSYVLRDTRDGTEVTYELAVELAVPMIGMFKRKAERAIIDTALKGLKKRVEASAS